MGYPTNSHIRSFAKGQTIQDISEDSRGLITLHFTSGESLRLWLRVKTQSSPQLETIATPIRKNGEVKQTTEIPPL